MDEGRELAWLATSAVSLRLDVDCPEVCVGMGEASARPACHRARISAPPNAILKCHSAAVVASVIVI